MIFIQSQSDSDSAANTREDVVLHELCRLDADDTVEEMFVKLVMVTYPITCTCPKSTTIHCIISFNVMHTIQRNAIPCHAIPNPPMHFTTRTYNETPTKVNDVEQIDRSRTLRSRSPRGYILPSASARHLARRPQSSARPGSTKERLDCKPHVGLG